MFSFKTLILDLFTFGCYSGYYNIKRLEDFHKEQQAINALYISTQFNKRDRIK